MAILFAEADFSHGLTFVEAEKALTDATACLPASCVLVGATSPSVQIQSPATATGAGQFACTGVGPGRDLQHNVAVPASAGLEASVLLGRFPDASFRSFGLNAAEMSHALDAPTDDAFLGHLGLATGDAWSVFVVLVAGDGGEGADKLMHRLQGKYPTAAIIGGVCEGAFRRSGFKVSYIEEGVVGLAMAGNVPLSALVSRGAKPLGGSLAVTDAEPVRTPSGKRHLLLQQARPVAVGGGGGSDGSGAAAAAAAAAGSGETALMPALQAAIGRSDQEGMQMYYIGVKAPGDGGFLLQGLSNDMFQQGGIVVPDDDGALAAVVAAGAAGSSVEVRFYQLDEEQCLLDAKVKRG